MPPIRTKNTTDNTIAWSDAEDSTFAPIIRESAPKAFLDLPALQLTCLESDEDDYASQLPVEQARLSRSSGKFYRKPSVVLIRAPRKPSSQQCETITVNGHVLKPTIVFDTFWRWCAERKSIDDRRRAGEPFPWTEDEIMKTKFFCNTYRVLDKTSQFIIVEVVQKGSQDPGEIVFRVFLFSIFTKIETWQWLEKKLGSITWRDYSQERYIEVLEKRAQTHTLYTGAFQSPGPKWDYQETYKNHLLLLQTVMDNDLAGKLGKFKRMEEAYAYIASFPSMGDFKAYQLLLNLSYSSVINFSGNDFVIPGIGAVSGLVKMFGKSIENAAKVDPNIRIAVIRYMMETQQQHFCRLGLQFSGLGPNRLPMELADMEHAICEVDKYARKAHPNIVDNKNGRLELRRKWTPSNDPYPATPVFPDAWSHARRNITRRCHKVPAVQKRWAVENIVTHRVVQGRTECNVHWYGYSSNSDTWEPVETLFEDTPEIVNAYWKKHFGKCYSMAHL
ncbi:hypothetical protein DFH05DRAFT_1498814 [Lentinula detonsa]|uniref:Chromo domain-containing protein n=1 Tax=Lentinula detonsa TaxID=2804962 RepID=A0A9W8NXV2_9AGAR|nr:hypothetical protein DFH05DRAFT_1498814 [Lentinula detonsa]